MNILNIFLWWNTRKIKPHYIVKCDECKPHVFWTKEEIEEYTPHLKQYYKDMEKAINFSYNPQGQMQANFRSDNYAVTTGYANDPIIYKTTGIINQLKNTLKT